MITTIIGDDGNEHSVVTQQYEIGLYVIVDSDPSQQGCVYTEEKEYHKMLRMAYKFIPEKSSVL